jgi:hypothetical protein
MLPFVNAIVIPLHLYLPRANLHHTLLDYCKYLMVLSYLWQMVHTRATKESTLDISEGSMGHGHGRGQASRDNALPPPPCPPISLEQLLVT